MAEEGKPAGTSKKFSLKMPGFLKRGKSKQGQPPGESVETIQPYGKPAKAEKKQKKKPKKHKADEKYVRSVSEIFREFKEKEILKERFVVMGVGNDLKGDDAVGSYVVDALRKEFAGDNYLLLIKTSAPEDHVNEVKEFAPTMVIMVDAADFGRRPGSIKIIKEYQISGSFAPARITPISLFLKLYQADQPVKSAVTVIGVQRRSSDFGQPMSGGVKKTGDMLAGVISGLYKNNTLNLALEREIARRSSAWKRIAGSLRKK